MRYERIGSCQTNADDLFVSAEFYLREIVLNVALPIVIMCMSSKVRCTNNVALETFL